MSIIGSPGQHEHGQAWMNGPPNGAIFAIRHRRRPTSIDQLYISRSLSGRPIMRSLDSGTRTCTEVPVQFIGLPARRTSSSAIRPVRVSVDVRLPAGHGNVQGRPRLTPVCY
jgi:hypothetical protein